jgi:methylglutaconyl-CoA hydratase
MTLQTGIDARGVATLTLARPEKHNALNRELIGELTEAADRLRDDRQVRVVVLTGAGASFCAGGDLDWMRAQMAADAKTRATEARALAKMLQALNTLPKPLIARVQGQAFGGGIGLMSVADVAIGVAAAKFGLTETRLGLIPATIGPYVIARMGAAAARRVFFSSRRFGADEAMRLGLLAQVVDPADLDAAVEREVLPYLSCAPGAVAEAKALVQRLGPTIDDDIIDATIEALTRRWESGEAAAGISAFFDRTLPPWGAA